MSNKFCNHYFPNSTVRLIDKCDVGRSRQKVAAVFELDITDQRSCIQKQNQQGNYMSLTAWVLKMTVNAIEDHYHVGRYLTGKTLDLFQENINLSMIFEKNIDGKNFAIPIIISSVNHKTIHEISDEIMAVKGKAVKRLRFGIPKTPIFFEKTISRIPTVLRKIAIRVMLRYPWLTHQRMGNVVLTSIGLQSFEQKFENKGNIYPISLGVGSVIRKPRVVNNIFQMREIVPVTVLLEEEMIKGMPVNKYIDTFKQHIENHISFAV